MRNRIKHLVTQTAGHTQLCQRPSLTLHADRPIKVDMERFFEFSFSFAEELLELEDKYLSQTAVVSLARELSLKEAAAKKAEQQDFDFDIDARWM